MVDLTLTDGLRMPAGFYTALQGVITPGHDDPDHRSAGDAGSTGQKMTVMAAE